jgi:cytochrome c oxidase assembly protein subunit 11
MTNRTTLWALAGVVAAMVGLAFASVPLYRLFCSVTGYGGTIQRAEAAPAITERWVTVSFDGNVAPGLAWDFAPEVKSLKVRLGDVALVSYRARNRGTTPAVATTTFNVQPDKAGAYFDKIQCFCFTRQTLAPGESIELPVQFFVDPALAQDRQTDDVQAITLSYTIFAAKDGG